MTRRRIAAIVASAGVAAVTALGALAAGPSPGVLQGGAGITVAGEARIVAAALNAGMITLTSGDVMVHVPPQARAVLRKR